jgi:SAM-dependent methyltransferase
VEPSAYEQTAAVEDRHWWFREMRSIWRALWPRRPGEPPARVLDAGCGTGGNLRALSGDAAIGCDLSAIALAHARRRSGAPLVRASILALPFRPGAFDIVLCTDVLYHAAVPDDRAALRELHRVLRPGGWLVVNLPAFESLRSAHDRAVHTARRYSRSSVERVLGDTGFRLERLLFWNGLLLPPFAVWRWFRRGRGTQSEITPSSGPVHAILARCARLDRALALRGLLPAGLSIAARARRPVS